MEYYSKVICNSKTNKNAYTHTQDNLETMSWLFIESGYLSGVRLKMERYDGSSH